MLTREVVVSNRAGLHARAAALIVKAANRFRCGVTIRKDDYAVNAKSLMGILTLAAVQGTTLLVLTEGQDEDRAMAELQKLFADKFGEGE